MHSTTEDVERKLHIGDSSGPLKKNASTQSIDNPLFASMVQTSHENYSDVVIVGAGPGGLMMAMTLARMGIKPTIIDAAGYESHEYGRADALQPRSMEVLQETYGTIIDDLEGMGKKIFGRAFWEMAGESTRRTALARFFPPFLDFDKDYALAVRQGLIEQVMIDDIERHCEGFEVQWNWEFLDMELSKTPSGPTTVMIRQTQTGEMKELTTKYVIAADGGRSSVRRWASEFGVKLEGESVPVTWCVLDAVGLKSNYPDLERLSVLRSNKGIVLIIPREPINGKPSARFDIQLANSKQEATQEEATKLIKEIFYPYQVEWDEVNWWSAYEVGQRIINRYAVGESVFFVGDACHTHSPRAGLGLNTAVLESHNLAWKMGLVLKGIAFPQILSTYEQERHAVAKDLIHMDRMLVEIYAGLEKQSIDDFSNAAEWLSILQAFQAANYAYQAGASIVYQRTLLTAGVRKHGPTMMIGKPGIMVGARARPAMVTRLSDSVPVSISSPFDGRFTVYFLVGDLSTNDAFERLLKLDAFVRRPKSIFSRYGSTLADKPSEDRLSVPRRHHSYSASGRIPPKGRDIYSYVYDDIPQATARFHGARHSILHTSVITTSGSTSSFVHNQITSVLYPRNHATATDPASPILRPQHLFSDDIPVVSPYRDSAPEAGSIFEHPMHSKWGVDPAVGSIVVARPDGHIAVKTTGFGVEAWVEVEAYFEAFLIPHKTERTSLKRKEMDCPNRDNSASVL
ncbi:FAD binding domain-containing protein [Lyophyllum atratum]|nr:FAD binding domain-containing protein [Lyophyllum atratum]